MPRPRGLRTLAALASGLLLALAHPAPGLGALAWVALVPLLLAIDGQSPPIAFRLGWIAGAVGFGVLLWWTRLFGLPAWGALVAAMAVFPALFAALCAWLAGPGRRGRLLWVAPLVWVATEMLRAAGPLAFPWGYLGLTQHRAPVMLALASLVGVFGVSALIAAANAVVAVTLRARRLTGAAAAAVALAGGATLAALSLPAPAPPAHRTVAAVQPNVDPRRPDAAVAAGILAQRAMAYVARARADGAQLIVLPETAIPADVAADRSLRRALAARAGGAVVVTGATAPGPRNAAVVVGPAGEVLGTYAKRRLVPFGEAGLLPGTDGAPVPTPAGRLGVLICYESAFPAMSRRLVQQGADALVVLTNDGWFGASAGPAQHAAHARFRAAETGRPLVRAANTGISMLVRPDGQPVAEWPLGAAGVVTAALPWGGAPAPYARWGWLWEPVALGAGAGLVLHRAWPALRARGAAVRALGVALAVPGIVWLTGRWAGDAGPGAWAAGLLLLLAAWRVGPRTFPVRGFWLSLAGSLVVTGALAVAVVTAYARYGFSVPVVRPTPASAIVLVLQATALEAWLRGAVLARAAALAGPAAGVAAAALVGAFLHVGDPQEVLLWHLLTGVVYGAIRLYSGDALGLGPARAAGDAVMMALARLRVGG
ncbi:MAG: apolipoprotein N-acyltransferase [Armatimonadota bacterium]|nr:apolipoprotein N-acyltransferase [Armatimonadota bacterium]